MLFFNDPLAIELAYVIPLRIVSSNDVDSILQGKLRNQIPDPDYRIASQWEITPKKFHHVCCQIYQSISWTLSSSRSKRRKNKEGESLETISYRTTYVEQNEIWKLITTGGKNQVSIKENTHSSKFTGGLNLLLDFSEDGNCTVSGISSIKTDTETTIDYPVTGNGTFINDGDAWGGIEARCYSFKIPIYGWNQHLFRYRYFGNQG